MPSNQRTTHYLRGNKAARYPRRIICLDSEALIELDEPMERHTLRLACASYDRVDWETNELRVSEIQAFHDPDEIWEWIEGHTAANERVTLWAHNLGYDLRLTGALEQLPARGWQLRAFAIDSFRCWMRWQKGRRSLTLVDSMSFLNRRLEAFAVDMEIAKPPLPPNDAPESEWMARCLADTTLLRAVVLRLIGWLRVNDCGDFRLTGAAQSSAAFRHRFLNGSRVLVHTNAEALEAERRSAWTGRCEVWRHGRVEGPLYEWDFQLAYARIAQDTSLPVQLRGQVGAIPLRQLRALSQRYAVLAEVEIETESETVPTESEDGIFWPTGFFPTLLWDNELRLALDNGAAVKIRRAWLYHRAPILREWAEWIIERLTGKEQERDPIGRRVLKCWSRQLIGRFGLRYPRWEEIGRTERDRLDYLPYVDVSRNERGVFLTCGRTLFEQAGKTEGSDSAPAIMAYIMAEARCRLWRAIQTAGFEHVVYCDTDSLIVDTLGSSRLVTATQRKEHPGLVWKQSATYGIFHAPRQFELAGKARVAGLPRNAELIEGRRYQAIVWEGVKEALWQQHPSEVRLHKRTIELRNDDKRRIHLPSGATAPLTLNAG